MRLSVTRSGIGCLPWEHRSTDIRRHDLSQWEALAPEQEVSAMSAPARNRIPEYWVLNLQDRRLEVYRHPVGEEYTEKVVLETGETLACLAKPDDKIAVNDLLP